MANILTDLSSPSLAVAIKANLYALFQSIPQATIHDSPPEVRWHTAVAHPWFNGVISAQPPTEARPQTVRDTLAYFQSRNVASFTWWLAPHLDRATWSQQLLAHGFQYDDQTPGMAIDLAALPPPAQHPLTIQRVEDRHTLAEWAYTFAQG